MIIPTDAAIEAYLDERFHENAERIQEETGAGLAPDILYQALQQVLYYWRKLKHIALSVTETEVRLNLPCQRTPSGREFGIEGVVDIVRDDDRIVMYDIKTHDTDYVRHHREEYEQQLNIYAHIWQTLREQDLDEAAVITTRFPAKLHEAIVNGDETVIMEELEAWDPVVKIPFDEAHVRTAIEDFGAVVDDIENGSFSPPSVTQLRTRTEDTGQTFAQRVCRNCDARFSCKAYRRFAKSSKGRKDFLFKEFFADIPDWEIEERQRGRLEAVEGNPYSDPGEW